jgi:hypothetical protein
MHFEVLTEDRSGGVVVEALMNKILKPLLPSYSIAIRPHRGKGALPDDPLAPPKKFASGLMDLLPAKLRAYDRVYAGTDFVLVVVMDSDDSFPDDVRQMLTVQSQRFAPGLRSVIGICVEETESWLLADEEAVLEAYPEADMNVIHEYLQDSVCGTWEVLCRAILREKARGLIRIGYPAIGQYKQEWAYRISRYLEPKRNESPSFSQFSGELIQISGHSDRFAARV